MNAHTAAHPDLPFGTLVLVTSLENGRNILLEVTDRGPSVAGREINLSYASARALDMVDQGLAPVQMEILER
jgi:rare lipoprotein A